MGMCHAPAALVSYSIIVGFHSTVVDVGYESPGGSKVMYVVKKIEGDGLGMRLTYRYVC